VSEQKPGPAAGPVANAQLRDLGRRPKLSAIIACYRDGPAIPHMYRRLKETFAQLPVDLEIVFVNDASPDDAEEVLARLCAADPGVVAVNHSRNFGSQAAFTSGMSICTGDMVVLMDGDLQDPPELIPQLLEKWQQGFDVVYGVRVKREATLFLQTAYKLFYRIFRRLSYVSIPRDAGDFSLIDRRVVEALLQMPERDRFLRGLRAWVGFQQTGVPYVRPERMFGRTTNNLLKNIAWARKGIFSFSYLPLEWISYLAFSVTTLSALAIAYYLGRWVVLRDAPRGFTTLLLSVLFLGSVQLLCLSIIGDYLGRVFEEVKQRPLYLVKSVFNDPRQRTGARERS
jgi:glycosyltransferase involved in cell wall biosynthesis